jgi:hypothetical protein
MLQGYVPNEGDAWRFTLDAIDRFEDALALGEPPLPTGSLVELSRQAARPRATRRRATVSARSGGAPPRRAPLDRRPGVLRPSR